MTNELDRSGAVSSSEMLAEKFRRARALHLHGQLRQAEALYKEILQTEPRHFDALHMLGVVASQRGDAQLSVEFFSQAIAVKPDQALIYACRGIALQSLGRLKKALTDFDAALVFRPDYLEALIGRGDVLLSLERFEEALTSYESVLAASPERAAALIGRGNALQPLERFDEALTSYESVSAVSPEYAAALIGRGSVLQHLGRFDEAMAIYDRALVLRPDDVEALNGQGRTLRSLMRFEDALASFDRALAIRPGYVDAHWQKSLTMLLIGDFARGWEEYEWRLQMPALRDTVQPFRQPRWHGQEPLAGKTIFVYAEQGLGDTLQFCRYTRLLAARGARVVLGVQPALKTLLAQLAGVDTLISHGEALPDFDFHCPLLSLPLAFRTDLGSIPAEQQYVVADQERVRTWHNRLGTPTGKRIGLVWAGNPMVTHDHTRRVSLELLTRLAMPGVELISIQKVLRKGDRALLDTHPEILHLGDELTDFSDTAAVIANLDLVISVDTAVAHLAGALGQPVWVLETFASDFRWLLDRDDSPWYPSARLFRQTRFGDWNSVIGQVEQALRQIV